MLTFKRRKDMFFSEAQRVPPLNNWNCAPPFLAPEVLPPLLIMLFFSFSLSLKRSYKLKIQKQKYKIQIQIYLHPPAFSITPLFSIFSPAGVAALWWKMENGPKLHQFPKTFLHYLRPPAFLLSSLFIFPSSPTAGSYAVEIQSRALAVGPSYPLQHFQTLSENHFCKSVLQRWLSHHCEKNIGGHSLILRWM